MQNYITDLLDSIDDHRRAIDDYRAVPDTKLQQPGGGGPQLDHIRFTRGRIFSVAEGVRDALANPEDRAAEGGGE